MDAGFSKWVNKGLIYIDQIFKGQILKSFSQLQKEFKLPAQDFYKFLQLRNDLLFRRKDKERSDIKNI